MEKLQLILTNPCSNRWDDMQVAGADRYCDNCEKRIVDLTDKSDAELIRFFNKKKDNVCGRLLSTQLNRELIQPSSKTGWQWLLPLAVGAMVCTTAKANELRPVIEQGKPGAVLLPGALRQAAIKSVAADTIRGRVLDNKTGSPLKGVKLREKGFENVVALTDSTGRFEISRAGGKLAMVFTFDLDGYQMAEMPLKNGMEVKLGEIVYRTMVGGITSVAMNHEPLYLIFAGKKSCTIDATKLKEIPPDWIEKIEILKDAQATALYGSKAANGVVLIEIKKAHSKNIEFSKKK